MLNLTEYVQANRFVDTITEETLNKVEHYSISYIKEDQTTMVRLFDENNKLISESKFDNAEMGIAILEEFFDLDESDQQWLDSYEWVNESIQIDEALDPVETFIERKATEYNIRIQYIDEDSMFDDLFGIEVVFHDGNNRRDVDKFVKDVGYELLRTYGVQSYDYDGVSWKLAL